MSFIDTLIKLYETKVENYNPITNNDMKNNEYDNIEKLHYILETYLKKYLI